MEEDSHEAIQASHTSYTAARDEATQCHGESICTQSLLRSPLTPLNGFSKM